MQLKNHYEKNEYNLEDGTRIKGTIVMSFEEYKKVILFIEKEYQKAVKKIDTYKRDSLGVSLAKEKKRMKTLGRYVCLGIEATKLIVKKYKLEKYKGQNYAVLITN